MSGLRERKKRRTREAIVGHAMRLFAERGFDATTIGDLAEAADIAPRTFFAYFATKEDVVFHDFDEIFAEFSTAIEQRPADHTAFDALRAWVADRNARVGDLTSDAHRARHALIRATPALAAHEQANKARFEEVVRAAVAGDLGLAVEALEVRMVGAAAVAAMEGVGNEEIDAGSDPLVVLDTALVFLNGGLGALREARGRGARKGAA